MLEENLEVGPFTPQEIEEVCEKLKSQGIAFEMIKDEAAEKIGMKNDYENVAEKTEWRTNTYLGQVFYLRMKQTDFDRNKELLSGFGMATTHIENPKELEVDSREIFDTHVEAVEHDNLKRLAARSLAVLLLILIICYLYLALKGV